MEARAVVFSAHNFEKPYLSKANSAYGFDLKYLDCALDSHTVYLAQGFPVVSAFVSDKLDRENIRLLSEGGTKLLALRSAGFNHVDLGAAKEFGIKVVRVPAYSPYAVAEHSVALMLVLNRKIHKAYNRVREGNFSLEGLMGFDFHGKSIGVIGTGKIGAIVAKIMLAFGCKIYAYDTAPDPDLKAQGVNYVPMAELFENCDVITLHCPLTQKTHHVIGVEALGKMKKGVMIINTSRGGLIDTKALIAGLKSGKVGSVGLDVYEEEAGLFFEDCSSRIINDDIFTRLLTFPNVLITGHQGFFTENALINIADTTLFNISQFLKGEFLKNEIL